MSQKQNRKYHTRANGQSRWVVDCKGMAGDICHPLSIMQARLYSALTLDYDIGESTRMMQVDSARKGLD